MEGGLEPAHPTEFRAYGLEDSGKLTVFCLLYEDSFLVHGAHSHLQSIEKLSGIHAFLHLLRLDLTSTIDAAARTRHQLDILIVAPLRLQLPNNVLDMLKPISGNELHRQVTVGNFLVVSIFALFVVKLSLNWYGCIKEFFGCPAVDILQIAIRGTATKRVHLQSRGVLT